MMSWSVWEKKKEDEADDLSHNTYIYTQPSILLFNEAEHLFFFLWAEEKKGEKRLAMRLKKRKDDTNKPSFSTV